MDVQRRDPTFSKLRVYPSADFVAVYGRKLTDDLSVSGQAGTVDQDYSAQRIETPVRRKRPGAIVKLEEHEGSAALWVSFDGRCSDPTCAFGFVQTEDGRFRLFQAPVLTGYSEATLFRKRIAPRKRMERSTLFSKKKSSSVFFTTRGPILSIALEVKKTRHVDIETIVTPQQGVRPGQSPSP